MADAAVMTAKKCLILFIIFRVLGCFLQKYGFFLNCQSKTVKNCIVECELEFTSHNKRDDSDNNNGVEEELAHRISHTSSSSWKGRVR